MSIQKDHLTHIGITITKIRRFLIIMMGISLPSKSVIYWNGTLELDEGDILDNGYTCNRKFKIFIWEGIPVNVILLTLIRKILLKHYGRQFEDGGNTHVFG